MTFKSFEAGVCYYLKINKSILFLKSPLAVEQKIKAILEHGQVQSREFFIRFRLVKPENQQTGINLRLVKRFLQEGFKKLKIFTLTK